MRRISQRDPLSVRGLETRLLLFIASGKRQQVPGQVKAGDLRSASRQLTRHPALPASQITNDFPLDLADERQQVWQDHFRVDRPLAQKSIVPLRDIIVRSLPHHSLLGRPGGTLALTSLVVEVELQPICLPRARSTDNN